MTGDDQPAASAADLDWAVRVQRLEAEVAGLRRAMASRGVIEQAKGVLAERLGCSPEEAFTHLSTMSQRSNVRLADVAASLLASMETAAADGPAGSFETQDAAPSSDRPLGGAAFVEPTTSAGTDDSVAGPADTVDAPRGVTDIEFAAAYRAVGAAVAAARIWAAWPTPCADVASRRISWRSTTPRISASLVACRSVQDAVAAGFDGYGDRGDWPISRSPRCPRDARCRGTGGPGPDRSVAAHPLRGDDGVGRRRLPSVGSPVPIGVARFHATERGYLGALAPVAQRAAAGMWGGHPHPVATALDLGYDPGFLLQPVRDDGGQVA